MHGKRPFLTALSTVVVLCLLSYGPPADLVRSTSTHWATPTNAPAPMAIGGIGQVDRIEPAIGRGGDLPEQRDWDAARRKLARKAKKFAASGPKRYDDPQGAMAFHVEQRLPPGSNRLPLEHLRRVRSDLVRREQANKNLRGTIVQSVTGWSSIGPGNVGGRTRALVIDPVNPSNMYAAGVAGGIWKSTDAGASWTPADDFMLNLAVVSLAIDPTNPNILYAGTGEGFFNEDSVRGLGIFKSIDAGITWTQLAGTVEGVADGAFHRVNDIVLSPNNPSHVYAATQFGVWRSLDAGTTWDVILTNPDFIIQAGVRATAGNNIGCTELAIRSDTNPDTIFAAFGSTQRDGLYRSQDGGASWMELGTTADLQNGSQGRMALAIAPSNNNVIYVSMSNSGGILVNVYRSVDGGDNWSPRVDLGTEIGPFLLSNLAFATGCFGTVNLGQGWYDNVIAVDPLDEEVVWVGGIDLFRSDDGAQNFRVASYWYFSQGDPLFVHADQHAIVFHPQYDGVDNQTMFIGNDGGLFRTDNARAMVSLEDCPASSSSPLLPEIVWQDLNNGYGVTQFYHGDTAKDSDVFAGGTQDNGTIIVASDTTPDSWEEIIGGDGGYFAIDPTNSQIMYGETQRFPRIRKSVNGGQSFTTATNGITDVDGQFITPFAMDQSDPNILWTGGSRAWRTIDGASLWTLASDDFSAGTQISAIGIAPNDSQIVYLGFKNGIVAKSTNALAESPTWTEFSSANGLNANSYVSSVTVDPNDPNIVYCTYSTFEVSHILRSVDGGSSWVSIDSIGATGVPDIPVHWLVVRPCNTDQLIVGTELGVFTSEDGGVAWQPANTGLAHTIVESLSFQNDYTVVAFTHGRGAFSSLLNCPCDPDETIVDCNGNREPDVCDLAFGVSPDCNGNGIPDECDFQTLTSLDCNGNNIPDECDPDCNGNGVPDDCDLTGSAVYDISVDDLLDIPRVCPGGSYYGPGTADPGFKWVDQSLGEVLSVSITFNVGVECHTTGTPHGTSLNGIPGETYLSTPQSCFCDATSITEVTINPDPESYIEGGVNEFRIGTERFFGLNPQPAWGNGIFARVTVDLNVASEDCNGNTVPDDCDPDCNGNAIPDDCDIASDPSLDCNNNSFPDLCDVQSGGFVEFDFENGLPPGWQTSGSFSVTDQCAVEPACNGTQWAYAGSTTGCSYGDNEVGELISPPITLGDTRSELRYCSALNSELDFDFAVVLVNGVEVARESGAQGQWEERVVDLTPFSGETVTITFRFESDGAVSGLLGWQVDHVRVISDSLDCNKNGVPDECDVAGGGSADLNGNAIPDECEGACCQELGDCLGFVTGVDACIASGGLFLAGQTCTPNPCPMPADPTAIAPSPHGRRKNRYISFAPNNSQSTAFRLELLDHACSVTGASCTFDSDCQSCSGGSGDGEVCNINSDCGGGSCQTTGESCNTVSPAVVLGWVGEPRDASCQNLDTGDPLPGLSCEGIDFVSRVVPNPVFRIWTEETVHLADCEIAPVHSYGLRASLEGNVFTEMTAYATTGKPQGKFWADVVGTFDGVSWSEPNYLVNVDDVVSWIRFKTLPEGDPQRPHMSWIDVAGEVPNWLANATDLQLILNAFNGAPYPPPGFSNQGGPADCP